MSNKYFPLFDEDMAAAITANGRFFIRKLSNYIEERLQDLLPQEKPYIVYGDTDSVYFHIEPFMEKYQEANPGLSIGEYVEWADQFEIKVIQPVIDKTIEDFTNELNAFNPDVIGVEREIIADCIAPSSLLRVKNGDETETLTISKLFSKFSNTHPQKRLEEFVDISDLNYEILSYNENTKQKELKKILNVHKKITSKEMITLIHPNGKKLTCTVDHQIAVNQDGEIKWKDAQFIKEDDDIVIHDNTFYNKENCDLYNIEYINHGSLNSDKIKRGNNISIDNIKKR